MPVFKAKLSKKSIDNLIKELENYKKKLEKLPSEIVKSACTAGEAAIAERITAVTDTDGNYLAEAGSEYKGNKGVAYMEGAQAKFLSFGTGLVGAGTYPGKLPNDWKYASGEKVHPVTGVWYYTDARTGKSVKTRGIEAQAPVLRSVDDMREAAIKAAKDGMK